ncbi:MAG: FtsX-like permease family protein [Pseudobdellovibrio sp.]
MKFKNSLSYFFLNKLVFSDRSGSLIRRITTLSFFAIVLSLTAFFIVLFVMNGMNRNIKSRIMSLEPHLTTLSNFSQENEITDVVKNYAPTIIKYQKFDLILRTVDGQFRGSEATGYSTEGLNSWMQQLARVQEESHHHIYSIESDSKLELGENEVAIGVDLARSLSLLEGDELTLIPPETLLLSSLETPLFQKVLVKRILVTDLYDLDSKLILFNSENTLKRFSNTLSRKTGFQMWFKSVDDADTVKQTLADKKINSETWKEKNSDLFFALKMEKLMIGTFLGLAGLIASSSILTVLALLMSQKKHDIAIIKTLGLSQQRTLWLFTKIGLWISGGAIALGTVLGLGISLYIEYNPVNVLPNIYYDSSIPASVNFAFVFAVLMVAGLLAFFGSYIPAKVTLGIQPAILLRQKN